MFCFVFYWMCYHIAFVLCFEFWPQVIWALRSPTRDRTFTPCIGTGKVLTTRPPGKSPYTFFFFRFHYLILSCPQLTPPLPHSQQMVSLASVWMPPISECSLPPCVKSSRKLSTELVICTACWSQSLAPARDNLRSRSVIWSHTEKTQSISPLLALSYSKASGHFSQHFPRFLAACSVIVCKFFPNPLAFCTLPLLSPGPANTSEDWPQARAGPPAPLLEHSR